MIRKTLKVYCTVTLKAKSSKIIEDKLAILFMRRISRIQLESSNIYDFCLLLLV